LNKNHERLIVPLDFSTLEEALDMVDMLRPQVSFFKVGMELFTSTGPIIIEELKGRGCRIFLDLKFHDIPNTVKRTCQVALDLGVDMFNIHSSGGTQMMAEAAQGVRDKAAELGRPFPYLLAVTVLTSLDESILKDELGVNRSVEEQVVHLANLAKAAGLSGVVASPLEIKAIRQTCGPDFCIVTPGIRPSWAVKGDQRRIMTPEDATRDGADFLVVGRPITRAEDPVEAARLVNEEIHRGLEYKGE
jgi:orotidine-5'-phosphate decarboxylase